MAGRRTAIIAISAPAVVHPAACTGDATEQTDAAVTIGTTAATDSVTTRTLAETTVGVADVEAHLQTVVEETVRTSSFVPGLVLHVEAPGPDLDVRVAAGVAELATATTLTPDAGLRTASNIKTFTASAILHLVEQGRLNLDAPIGALLAPETVDALRSGGYRPEAISVRHVLVHTSGIYDVGRDPAYQVAVNADPSKRWTGLEHVRFAMDHGAPVGEPGAVYAYSDTGYGLLGKIIERAVGAPLADAYRTLLDFEGLHLDATYLESWEPAPPGRAARAHQYVGDIDGFDGGPSFDPLGAAGLVSTVDDLSRFYRALLRGEVFRAPGHSPRCSRSRPATPRPEL